VLPISGEKCWVAITLQVHLKVGFLLNQKFQNNFISTTELAEFLDWETTPVFTDEEAGPICGKNYS
tara:strand:+ start:1167 stop:1364 length:198 start_codon:yes stop_codon:yes gene_type:complete